MKKLELVFISLGLLLTIISSGQTALTFRFANPKVVYYTTATPNIPIDGEYFEFDLLVKANGAEYFYSGEVNLRFNPENLISDAGGWIVTKGTVLLGATGFSQKYNLLPNNITDGLVKLPFAGNVTSLQRIPFAPADWNQIPTNDFATLVNVKVFLVGDATDVAGIKFDIKMDDKFSYISGSSDLYPYGTNVYDSADFTTTYLGRIYANGAWTQTGGSTNGVAFLDWPTAVNTSVWDGAATIPTSGESQASAVRIHSNATLTIPPTGRLTAASIESNATNGLVIQSDATGTGSLITESGSGSAVAQRWMAAGKWNIVSSPLSGQAIGISDGSFLKTNSTIATKGTDRGMMDYNPTGIVWNSFFTDESAGIMETGKGFSMRVGASDAVVTFTGTLQTGEQPVTASGGYWNCIGNPYTSAIGITVGSSATANFLTANASNFESSYGAIYVWNAPDASNGNTGNYTVISNTLPAFNEVQQGQAFLVNTQAGVTSFDFTSAMQIHNTGLSLKSSEAWPVIKLEAASGSQVNSTIIAFNNGMTKGLDPTYDAGLLKGSTDLLVYSKLVDGNGIPFAIQALPDNDFNGMIIPVGIDFKTGGNVVFSAGLTNLPEVCKVILEDKSRNVFTDLALKSYSVGVEANSSIADRFFIHTSHVTTGIDEAGNSNPKLKVYAVQYEGIRIEGSVTRQAIATLYDLQGRAVFVKNLAEGNLNLIQTSGIKTGTYMLQINDNKQIQGFKIPVNE